MVVKDAQKKRYMLESYLLLNINVIYMWDENLVCKVIYDTYKENDKFENLFYSYHTQNVYNVEE